MGYSQTRLAAALARRLERSSNHALRFEDWTRFLRALPSYGDPPTPPTPMHALATDARAEVMRVRHAQGFHLYHPEDATPDDISDRLDRQIILTPGNNRSVPGRLTLASGTNTEEQDYAESNVWEAYADRMVRAGSSRGGNRTRQSQAA